MNLKNLMLNKRNQKKKKKKKSRDITLPTKICLIQAMVFPYRVGKTLYVRIGLYRELDYIES